MLLLRTNAIGKIRVTFPNMEFRQDLKVKMNKLQVLKTLAITYCGENGSDVGFVGCF